MLVAARSSLFNPAEELWDNAGSWAAFAATATSAQILQHSWPFLFGC